mgnify:CR=1 FL=1
MAITLSEREELQREQSLSGQSIAEYCRTRGLSPKSFYNWRKSKVQAPAGMQVAESRFVRVDGGAEAEVTLEVPSARGVIKMRVSVEHLCSVIDALGGSR